MELAEKGDQTTVDECFTDFSTTEGDGSKEGNFFQFHCSIPGVQHDKYENLLLLKNKETKEKKKNKHNFIR